MSIKRKKTGKMMAALAVALMGLVAGCGNSNTSGADKTLWNLHFVL